MSDDILDIVKWKNEYPFLDKVLDTYMKFDEPIEVEDTWKNIYGLVCDKIITDLQGDIQKNKHYCMKLIRNLGQHSYDTYYFNPTFERCNILYNWLYHSSKREKIPDNIIKKCFNDYNFRITRITNTYKCSYDLYKNTYLDPIKINILNIFDNNMENIKNILIDMDNSNKTHCRKFVCECLKIYKYMYETYCLEPSEQSPIHQYTCLMLRQFSTAYKFFHNNLLGIDPEIPSLDDAIKEISNKCEPYVNIPQKIRLADENSHGHPNSRGDQELTGPSPSGVYDGETIPHNSYSWDMNGENQPSPVSSTVSTNVGTVTGASSLNGLRDGDTAEITSPGGVSSDIADRITSSSEVHVENQVSPMSRTVSTAIGTVAGTSSILALLYKFSPAKRWVHSGIRGNRGKMKINFYDDTPNELLFDGIKGEYMRSHNTRYNIGYGTV